MIQFTPKKETSIIKVIGVGGGGSNAVNHMFKEGIEGVDFVVCNTDVQALTASPVPVKIQLGESGLGAGSIPERAEKAAIESLDKFEEVLDSDTEMLFITAGMGGGTGTGAAPVIAKFAREKGLLTVGIVTLPFRFEGRRKLLKAKQGIEEMRKYVDTLLVISNDKLRDQYGDLGLGNAFAHADNVLTTAAKGIAELITVHGYVNVDFQDVKTVMKDSGKAIMGSAMAEGDDRALKAIEEAMRSPLLNDNDVRGANNILLYITAGTKDVTMDEITEITNYIAERCGEDSADVIWGRGIDEEIGDNLGVTIIATGFESESSSTPLYSSHKAPSSSDINQSQKDEQSPLKEEESSDKQTPEDKADNESGEEPGEKESEKETGNFNAHAENRKPIREKKVYSLLDDLEDEKHTAQKPDIHVELPGESQGTEPFHPIMEKIVKKSPENVQPGIEKRKISPEEGDAIEQNSKNRIEKLKKLSSELTSSSFSAKNFKDEENIPAYLRQNIQLSDPNYSTQSEVSRFMLGEDSKNNPVIKSDNSFLHDNVD